MYNLGHQVLPSISVATMLLHGYTAYTARSSRAARADKPGKSGSPSSSPQWRTFATAGAITVLMLPFTWVVMAPTNTTLFGLEARARLGDEAEWGVVKDLVSKWRLLHMVRSCFPLVGSLVGLSALWA